MQPALHPCEPLLINNRNMTDQSAKKECFAVLNVKLQVKLTFKMCYSLPTQVALLNVFAYPSKKQVTSGPELNL